MKINKEYVNAVLLGFGVGAFLGVMSFLLVWGVPQPPPGICDGKSSPEECIEWWEDIMERP